MSAKYQLNPKESHYNAAKRIIKYLKGATNVGMWYLGGVSLNLVGFSDFDFAGCKLDKKNTSGTCHLFRSNLDSWHSNKQTCIVLSTIEIEYTTSGSCCA